MLNKMDKQGTKDGDCQTLPRQCRRVLHKSWFIEKPIEYSRCLGRRRMPQHCRRTMVCLQGNQLLLPFLRAFGAHLLVLPACLFNIISLSGLWGSWRLVVIVGIFLVSQIQERNSVKNVKYIRLRDINWIVIQVRV